MLGRDFFALYGFAAPYFRMFCRHFYNLGLKQRITTHILKRLF